MMGKPKKIGMRASFVPNAKADRKRKKQRAASRKKGKVKK